MEAIKSQIIRGFLRCRRSFPSLSNLLIPTLPSWGVFLMQVPEIPARLQCYPVASYSKHSHWGNMLRGNIMIRCVCTDPEKMVKPCLHVLRQYFSLYWMTNQPRIPRQERTENRCNQPPILHQYSVSFVSFDIDSLVSTLSCTCPGLSLIHSAFLWKCI